MKNFLVVLQRNKYDDEYIFLVTLDEHLHIYG